MRLIDANALKEKAEPEEVTGEGIVYVQDIDEAPTVDAVEVVRCKECAWYETGKSYIPYCNHPTDGMSYPAESDFCSYGERKAHD